MGNKKVRLILGAVATGFVAISSMYLIGWESYKNGVKDRADLNFQEKEINDDPKNVMENEQ